MGSTDNPVEKNIKDTVEQHAYLFNFSEKPIRDWLLDCFYVEEKELFDDVIENVEKVYFRRANKQYEAYIKHGYKPVAYPPELKGSKEIQEAVYNLVFAVKHTYNFIIKTLSPSEYRARILDLCPTFHPEHMVFKFTYHPVIIQERNEKERMMSDLAKQFATIRNDVVTTNNLSHNATDDIIKGYLDEETRIRYEKLYDAIKDLSMSITELNKLPNPTDDQIEAKKATIRDYPHLYICVREIKSIDEDTKYKKLIKFGDSFKFDME